MQRLIALFALCLSAHTGAWADIVNLPALTAANEAANAYSYSFYALTNAASYTPSLVGSGNEGLMAVSDGYNLVLIGMVSERNTQRKVEGVTVQLEDKVEQSRRATKTSADGTFYFKLLPDRQYQLYALDENANIVDTKLVSTINRNGPEILHAVLEVEPGRFQSLSNESTMVVPTTPLRGSPVPMPTKSGLLFKVQVGAFKEPLAALSPYLTGVKEKVVTETTSTGFIRYVAGEFTSLRDAELFLQQLQQKGYSKAFIVPYNGNVRLKIKPEEAEKQFR